MKRSILATIGLCVASSLAQDDYLLTIYKDEGCQGGDSLQLHTFKSSADTCQQGTSVPTDDWERNSEGQYKGYIDGAGLEAGCKIGLLKQSSVEPNRCGNVIAILNGDTGRQCKQYFIDETIGLKYCCGKEQCDSAGLNVRRRSIDDKRTASPPPAAYDHVAKEKRSPLLRPRACSWNGAAPKVLRSPNAVRLTSLGGCSNADGCTRTESTTIGSSSTNSFGVSTEAGASFFEIVQASISFSYTYSYTKSEDKTVSYSVNQPQGSTGYIAFYQFYECTDGHFEGGCDWDANKDGSACVPKLLPNGFLDGDTEFVRES